jgi:hypothetical protein
MADATPELLGKTLIYNNEEAQKFIDDIAEEDKEVEKGTPRKNLRKIHQEKFKKLSEDLLLIESQKQVLFPFLFISNL